MELLPATRSRSGFYIEVMEDYIESDFSAAFPLSNHLPAEHLYIEQEEYYIAAIAGSALEPSPSINS